MRSIMQCIPGGHEWPGRSRIYFCYCFLSHQADQLLRAQAIGGGQIQGTVTDANADPQSPARRSRRCSTASGLQRTLSPARADGGYNLPDLPVGPYTAQRQRANGFSTYQQTGIVIEVGNNLRIDPALKVGGATQTVQVAKPTPRWCRLKISL